MALLVALSFRITLCDSFHSLIQGFVDTEIQNFFTELSGLAANNIML